MTCLKNLKDFRFYGLMGYNITMRTEAASYYETTLRHIPEDRNFVVA
jgi:hypothetical protein